MAAAMLRSVSSSMFFTSRASSITCCPSRTSMPAFCNSNIIGGSTTSTPTGMSATPSSCRMARISFAASRKRLMSPPVAAAQAEQPRAAVIGLQPRRIELVVARRAAEIPDVGLTRAGKKRIARQLVTRPFADDRARGVADVVLVEAKERAEAGMRERGAHPPEAIGVQPAKVDALLEIDLRASRRLQRPVPAVMRVDVVRTDLTYLRLRLGRRGLLRHSTSSKGREILAADEFAARARTRHDFTGLVRAPANRSGRRRCGRARGRG